MGSQDYKKLYTKTLATLQNKKRILFLVTSNRYTWGPTSEIPKSTQLAQKLASQLWDKVEIIDVTKLNIEPCHGNVSNAKWNVCWIQQASLKDPEKNPTGNHRCRASFGNAEDELWKISKSLFEADTVVFFTSVRWWQTNSFYQKLIERLTWLENRHSTLGEDNIIKNIDAWIIITAHNWNSEQVLDTQKKVLDYYGFHLSEELCWNWYYTTTATDETNESYKQAAIAFHDTFDNI